MRKGLSKGCPYGSSLPPEGGKEKQNINSTQLVPLKVSEPASVGMSIPQLGGGIPTVGRQALMGSAQAGVLRIAVLMLQHG